MGNLPKFNIYSPDFVAKEDIMAWHVSHDEVAHGENGADQHPSRFLALLFLLPADCATHLSSESDQNPNPHCESNQYKQVE